MDDGHWFLPLASVGIAASTIAHSVTIFSLSNGSAVEGNPFAVMLGLGGRGVPLAAGLVGAAYVLTWEAGEKARTRAGALLFRTLTVAMTAFFLVDMLNDLAVVF